MPDMSVTDRSLIWNSDLMEALEFENLIANGTVTMAECGRTATKAAARRRTTTTPSATTPNG